MKLLIKRLGKTIYEADLEPGREFFAGRQDDCDFVLKDDPGLSRKHIKISQDGESGLWAIEALSETEKLYLEGEPVQKKEIDQPLCFALKSCLFEFYPPQLDVPEETQIPEALLPAGPPEQKAPEAEGGGLDEATKIIADSHLVYSLSVSIEGEGAELVDLNEGSSWTLGRSTGCDIAIQYKFLGRKHLKITRSGGQFYVTDLGSSNGTALNDKDLRANRPHPLQPEDRILIGELSMVFEARNRHFDSMMKNLPAISFEETKEDQPPAAMAFPKIILEDSLPDEEGEGEPGGGGGKKGLLSIKRIIMYGGLAALLGGFYLADKKKKDEKKKSERMAEIEKSLKKTETYNLARQFHEQKKFQFCIETIENFYKGRILPGNVADLLNSCKNGEDARKKLEEHEEQKRKQKETEEKIKKLAAKCAAKAEEFQSVEDLMLCAGPVLELDPENSSIHAIKLRIEERETRRQIEEEKKNEYRKMIQSKMSLYRRAKRIHEQNMPLKAVAAYDVFLRSAGGIPALRETYQTAERARNSIQSNYDNNLRRLYEDCESLIQDKKMKEAYYECQSILKFKKKDQKAIQWMALAKKTLQDEMQPIYQQGAFEESLARIPAAKKFWEQIIKKDIKEGVYYQKARHQLDKYKSEAAAAP